MSESSESTSRSDDEAINIAKTALLLAGGRWTADLELSCRRVFRGEKTVEEELNHFRQQLRIAKRVEALRHRFAWISSVEVATMLYSNDSDALDRVEVLCTRAPLIAVSDGENWEFPVFQFDREAGAVVPIVAYANRKMKADTEPWGALSWWETPIRLGGGKTPLELLAGGGLNEKFIDNVFASYRLGM